jgi:hypothetical protein
VKIYLKLSFDFVGKIRFGSNESSFRFTVSDDNKHLSIIEIIPTGNRIDTYQEIDCSEKSWNDFKEHSPGKINFKENPSPEIKDANLSIIRDTKKVLYFVKYYLGFIDLDGQLCTPKNFLCQIIVFLG